MTNEREAEIRARLTGATPGPWKYEWESAGESDNFTASIYEDDYKGLLIGRCNQNGSHHGDEEFIANAPADVAELLDELDRLRAAAEGLEAWLTYMDSESEGLQFAQCDEKGRELGLFRDKP